MNSATHLASYQTQLTVLAMEAELVRDKQLTGERV